MRRALLSLLFLGLVVSAAPASAQDSRIERSGVYVIVSDLGRARVFYEALFEKPPYVATPAMVAFDVAGGTYALASAAAFRPNVRRGDNAVPYVRVSNIEAEYARVRRIAPTMLDVAVVAEGPIRLFRFADPDGNLVEFFELAAPPGR